MKGLWYLKYASWALSALAARKEGFRCIPSCRDWGLLSDTGKPHFLDLNVSLTHAVDPQVRFLRAILESSFTGPFDPPTGD